jgi:predicted nucleotidyltransferase
VRRADINPIIREEIAAILSSCKPKSVFLFGSAARDEMTDSSDIDLLVVVADGSDLKGIKQKYYCRRKTHTWPVDIIFLEQTDFDRKCQVGGVAMICKQEGILLHEAKE